MDFKLWKTVGKNLIVCLIFGYGLVSTGSAQASNRVHRQQSPNLVYLPQTFNGPFRIPFNFSPYIDGQNPNTGVVVPESQIRERLKLISSYVSWIRTFSCGNGLQTAGRIAHELGIKIAMTAWIGKDLTVNQQQISCLINEVNAGHVDLAVVGSEAILRGDVSVDTLKSYLDQVRLAIPSSIPITTGDVYTVFLDNPTLVVKVDLIFANLYPFWEGYDIDHATAIVDYMYNLLVSAYPGKTISISETGWPSCGSHQSAIGNPANQATFFNQIESWAKDKNITLFYFEALDETWKIASEGPQGGCWGIFDKLGVMKDGMSPVFQGNYSSYNLSLPLTCDTSTFSFEFTYLPPIGSFDNITGRVCGVFYRSYKVVTFILVNGNWWIKPYINSPTVSLGSDGAFSVDYTTGGNDEQATEIRMYLIPLRADPFGDLSSYQMIDAVRTQ